MAAIIHSFNILITIIFLHDDFTRLIIPEGESQDVLLRRYIQQKEYEDEGDERQEQSPDGVPITVSRQLLNGNDSQQYSHKIETRLSLKTEAQQRGDEGVDEDHVGDIDHRYETLRKTQVG